MISYHSEISFLLIWSGLLFAQSSDSTSIISDQLIENLITEPVTNFEEFNLIDYLEELQKEPININTADLATLQKIPELDINNAKLIIQHRNKYGHFFSTNELFTIIGIPKYVINDIKPFITISDPIKQETDNKLTNTPLFSFARVKLRSRILLELNDYDNLSYKNYQGSTLKIYNKLTLLNEHSEGEILTEKDPGEKSYYDFISFYILIKNIGPIEKAIFGDYNFEFGQGLVLWGPFGFSKTTDAIFPINKRENIIHPYNGTDENRYFRGIATSINYYDIKFSLFYSNHNLDASIDTTSGYISSLITSGYHRTDLELIDHNSLNETAWGSSCNYSYNNLFHLGFLFYSSKFNKPLSGTQLYTPRGERFNYLSASYDSYIIPSIYLAGEIAYDFRSIASLNTIQISFNKNFLFVSSIRNYPRNFISLHGNSLAEQKSKVQNETGFYNGFKLLTGFGTINFYYDQFKFPFGGYRFPISDAGEEFLFSYANTFKEDINIKINCKYENKDYLLNQDDQKSIARRGRKDFRLILSWNISKEVRLKSIIEYNTIRVKDNNLTEEGALLTNSININLINNLKLTGSISFFKTDSFLSSVYEYDNNIGGLVRGEVLYGEGTKIKLYLSYKLFQKFTFSAQYSEIIKPKELLINPIYSIMTDNVIFQIDLLL